MKTCFRCKKTKPLAEFYRHATMADGHLGKCRGCCKLDAKIRRLVDDDVRVRDRARSRRKQALISANAAAWRRKHPDRYRAQTAIGNAIRDGKLTQKPCERCGASGRVHAHHHDYAKPLDVEWLCPRCHARTHSGPIFAALDAPIEVSPV